MELERHPVAVVGLGARGPQRSRDIGRVAHGQECLGGGLIAHHAVLEEPEGAWRVGVLGEGERYQGQAHAHEDHVAVVDLAPGRDDHELPLGEARHHEWRTKGLEAEAV